MYDNSEPKNNRLRTGDVVKLDFNDFQSISRHNSILDVFKDFKKNYDYNNMLWAVLNKNCDMVHDSSKERYFKNNLFLIPLQGLKSALRKGTIKGILHHQQIKNISSTLLEAYKKYLSNKAKKEQSQHNKEDTKTYNKIINKGIKQAVDTIKDFIPNDISDYNHPQALLTVLKENPSLNDIMSSDLVSFEASKEWENAITSFDDKKEEYQERDSKIIFKKDAEKIMAQLALNQLDSQGIFYYEPHTHLFDPNCDNHD